MILPHYFSEGTDKDSYVHRKEREDEARLQREIWTLSAIVLKTYSPRDLGLGIIKGLPFKQDCSPSAENKWERDKPGTLWRKHKLRLGWDIRKTPSDGGFPPQEAMAATSDSQTLPLAPELSLSFHFPLTPLAEKWFCGSYLSCARISRNSIKRPDTKSVKDSMRAPNAKKADQSYQRARSDS